MRGKLIVFVAVGVAALAIGAGSAAAYMSKQAATNAVAATAPPSGASQNADSNDQQPSYKGSVTVPSDSNGQTEGDESKALAGLAKISADDAKKAALNGYPAGATATTPVLEDENGNVVYGVEVTSAGKTFDVKVDAGNGKVLATEEGGADGGGESGATETNN